MLTCSQCGQPNKDGMRFCRACGHQLQPFDPEHDPTRPIPAPAQYSVPDMAPPISPGPAMMGMPTGEAPFPQPPPPSSLMEPPPQRRNRRWPAILLVTFLAVVLGTV